MSDEKEEQEELSPAASASVPIQSVLNIVEDWVLDYFVPISLPPHTKAHIDAAITQLRERIKGLSP
jgi:hypothetical protein